MTTINPVHRIASLALVVMLYGGCGFDSSGTPTNPGDGSVGDTSDGSPNSADSSVDSSVDSNTVGYWRMEMDTDDSAILRIENEVSGGTALVADDGEIAPSVPVDRIPATNEANIGAINCNNDLNGAIAPYASLTGSSMTIEFWARATETQARLIEWTDNISQGGIVIENPRSINVQFVVNNGQVPIPLGFATGHAMSDTWHHYAFTYDEVTGKACFYVDGALPTPCIDSADARPLLLHPNAPLRVGEQMDGVGTDSFFDELRVSNIARSPGDFLRVSPGQ